MGSMMKSFTLLFVVVTMTIALTAGAMASPDQDLIQCVSWNGTYSLMNLYTAFNKTNPSGLTMTPVPGTNPEELGVQLVWDVHVAQLPPGHARGACQRPGLVLQVSGQQPWCLCRVGAWLYPPIPGRLDQV